MKHLETQAYHDESSEEDFMEEAGSGVALVVHDFAERYNLHRHIVLACGKGNNAGDAYVAGIHLLHLDYDVVALQVIPLTESSALCQQKHNQFLAEGGHVIEVRSPDEVLLPERGLIIDGIFGTGFHGILDEPVAGIVRLLNESHLPIIAVDVPSGLNGETGEAVGEVIQATETAFLGLPKTGFFLKDGWNHVGRLRYVDFGLPRQYIDSSDCDLEMLTTKMLHSYLPKLVRNRNKYQAGYVVGVAGSPDMPGAAILSSIAALQSGAGIVRLLYPEGMQQALVAAPAELIKTSFQTKNVDAVIDHMNKASANFIGPGIGRSEETVELLKAVLPKLTKPCVIDADALTLWAQWEGSIPLPEHTIMTPHLGEMKRLLGKEENLEVDMQTLYTCQAFAEKHQVTLVLKGGPSFILHPQEPIMVSACGDPGMATAGSGDVLTGLLAALLSQGMSPYRAALLGVYLHGVAGEYAAEDLTSYSMTATDILYRFPDAFRLFEI
jgi:NAD(P)H-hydrate epimerase